jgi:hypothetical protein
MSHRACALLVLLLACPASAATRHASNDGVDSTTCGSKAEPCRSISRAISHAAPGDTVLVGPGRYGNLDRDGQFGEDGEEGQNAGCLCAVHVDRPVSLRSRAGAAATVIEGVGAIVLRVDAPRSEIGRRNAGFTIRVTDLDGIRVAEAATDVKIGGNLVVETPNALANNMFVVDGDGGRVADNRVYTTESGMGIAGTRSVAERNAVLGGGSVAFRATFRNHVNIGAFGIIGVGDAAVERSLLAGNLGPALWTQETSTLRAERNSLYGNNAGGVPDPAFANCGALAQGTSTIEAAGSYWGGFLGPSDQDPADDACTEDSGTVATDPPAQKEIRVKLRPIR